MIVYSPVPCTNTVPSVPAIVTLLPSAPVMEPLQVREVTVLFPVTVQAERASIVTLQVPLPPSPAFVSS